MRLDRCQLPLESPHGRTIRVGGRVGLDERWTLACETVAADGTVIAQGVPLEGHGRWLRERRHVRDLPGPYRADRESRCGHRPGDPSVVRTGDETSPVALVVDVRRSRHDRIRLSADSTSRAVVAMVALVPCTRAAPPRTPRRADRSMPFDVVPPDGGSKNGRSPRVNR